MNEYEQFAKAFRCTPSMAESIVKRIRERVGREVPMSEILNAIRKIPPTRLTTDTLVARLQKNNGTQRLARNSRSADDLDDFDDLAIEEAAGEPASATHRVRTSAPRHPTGIQGQIDELLQKNWTQARATGLNPPNMSTSQFVRMTQSNVGEPKPSVARVLAAVQALSRKDVLITPNLAADEIIETDELR